MEIAKYQLQQGQSLSDKKRLQFLRKGVYIGFAAEASFLIVKDFRAGEFLPIVVDLYVIFGFLLAYILSYKIKNKKIVYHLITFVISSAVLFSLYTASASRAAYLTPLGILVGFLLLSRRGGVMWFIFTYFGIVLQMVLHNAGILHHQLDQRTLSLSMISVLLISACLFVYEGINITNEKIIAARDKELVDLNEQLSSQLEKNKKTSTELAKNLEKSQRSNVMLKDTKLAIMNILEDTNNLQAQLVEEKKNVENTVKTRTKELRHEQARLRASIDSLSVGFLMVFKNKQASMYNPALLSILSLQINEEDSENILNIVQNVLGKSYDLKKEIEKSLDSNKAFYVKTVECTGKLLSITGAPIIMKEEKAATGCVVLIEDKTESRMLERSKDEFMSIASHELRTPLTAIKGNTVMLETIYGSKIKDKGMKEVVADIKDSSTHLIGIINQFLSTSRLEQKRTVFELKPVNVKKQVQETIKNLKGLAEEKKLELFDSVPTNLPKIVADKARFQEVLVNMIGNAIKYTDKGHIEVKAEAIGGHVEIEVIDTGNGIEAKNHNLLFHKFQQATSNILTREDSRSTGLGLYISKLLVEQMGGQIGLKSSKPSEGSVFYIKFPITKENTSKKRRENGN